MCIFGAPGVCSRGLLEFSLGFVTSQALLLQNHGLNPHHCFFFCDVLLPGDISSSKPC